VHRGLVGADQHAAAPQIPELAHGRFGLFREPDEPLAVVLEHAPGVGSGAVSPAIRRVVITRDPEGVGANLGRLASFEVTGFVLGPLLAALSAQLFGIRAPFLLLATVLVVVVILTARLDLSAGPVTEVHHVFRGLLAASGMKAALAACVAFYVTVGIFEAVWAVLLSDHGAQTWLIGLTLSLFTVPMIFLAPVGGREAQRRGPIRVVSLSIAVATICTFSYGVLPSLWMILAVSAVHAVADSFTMPGIQVAAALASPPEHASSAQGLLGATGLAVAGLTGLVAGFAYQHAGRFVLFGGTSVTMTVFLLAAITLDRRTATRTSFGASPPLREDSPIQKGSPDSGGQGVPGTLDRARVADGGA
jgi:MFS family permease